MFLPEKGGLLEGATTRFGVPGFDFLGNQGFAIEPNKI